MESRLGPIVVVSLVLAAAPTLAVSEATEPSLAVEDTYEDEEIDIHWESPDLGERSDSRLQVDASADLGDVEAETRIQVPGPEMDRVLLVKAGAGEGDNPTTRSIEMSMDTHSDGEGPCVQIYIPQTPPVVVDPECIPDIGWDGQPPT